jgi:hypothetical protein
MKTMRVPFHAAALSFSFVLVSAGCTLLIDGPSYHARSDASASTDAGSRDAEVGCSACGQGETCVEGVCRCGEGVGCAEGSACCDGTCTPLGTLTDCTSCGDACGDAARAASTCGATGCEFECDEGFADCDTSSPDCEQSLLTPTHCGACGNGCPSGELCGTVAGEPQCVSSCAASEAECSGACVDTSTHVLHCGGCDQACPEPPGSSAVCTASTCGVVCDPGFGLCGGSCVALQTYYRDADGDGFGNPGGPTEEGCPGSPPNGFSATNDDCDDLRPTIHLNAAEVCDGLDQDCDGIEDEDFECAGSDTQSCTITVGSCTAVGTQSCVSCGWGACVGNDVCDRTDDDCDGYIDEGGLRGASGTPLVALTGYRFQLVKAAYNPNRREIGAITLGFDGTTFTLYFVRIDAVNLVRIGTPTTIATGSFGGNDIAWDGQHYTVAVSQNGVHLYRVDASTAVATRVHTLEASGGSVSVGRLGSSGSDIVVAWSGMGSVARIHRFSMPGMAGATPTAIGTQSNPLPGGGYNHFSRIANTPSGAVVFYQYTTTGMAPYDLYTGGVSSTSVGSFTRQLTGVSEVFAAYEPMSGQLGAAIGLYDGSTFTTVFRTMDTNGALVGAAMPLGGQGPVGIGYGGEPGQLAVFSGMYFPASGSLTRIRMSDRTLLSSAPLSIGGFNGMVGVPEGPARFFYFEDDSTNLNAYPVVCPP